MIGIHIAYRWKETGFGVLQGATLGPMLLNILHSNLYLGVDNTDFPSDADDNNISDIGNCMSSFFLREKCSSIILVIN